MANILYITKTPNTYRLAFRYDPDLLAPVKRIPSAKWDAYDKVWVIDARDPRFRNIHPQTGQQMTAQWYINALAAWAVKPHVFNGVQKLLAENVKWNVLEADDEYEVADMLPFTGEHYMKLEPYKYQLEGVRYALDHKKCIFGDQPGLGKTLQAICTVVKAHNEAAKYGETFPTLVICPAALKVNWQREFQKFAGLNTIILDDKNADTWHLFFTNKNLFGQPIASVFITNYESLKKFFVRRVEKKEGKKSVSLKDVDFDPRVHMFRSVIIDESHKCKASDTQQSKYVEGICRGKQWVLELTGTPVVNCNMDLIQQLKILGTLNHPRFGGYKRFVEQFCDGPTQSSNNRRLNKYLWDTCFFRREKQKVLTQLPDKTRQTIICDITNSKEYTDCEMDMVKYLRQYKNADDDKVSRAMRGEVMVKMSLLKQVAAKGKIKTVASFIHDIIDGEHGQKLILFAYLKDVIHELKKEFPDAVTVTGSDNISQKQAAVDAFQQNPNVRLIILNYKSGGTGLTLTASSRVAFIEFPWTYSDCEQAEDRAHRNGQKDNVTCYYFLGKGTIDEYMYDVIQQKKTNADEVTGTSTQIEENVVDMTMGFFAQKYKI